MRADSVVGHTPRPASEVEWEDLLLRLEVMPRALRVLLEEVDANRADTVHVLGELLARESLVRDFLERAAGGDPAAQSIDAPAGLGPAAVAAAPALERFVRLRTRNFAMVQRRGIEVWEWRAALDGSARPTVHQVLVQLVAEDVGTLAAIRGIATAGAGVC